MISIFPAKISLDHTIDLPGSKYVANRALVMAALARGESNLIGVPFNEDIQTAMEGLSQLGCEFTKLSRGLRVRGIGAKLKNRAIHVPPETEIYTSASGTFSRFIASIVALLTIPIALKGTEKMNTRPMGPLFGALEKLGVKLTPQRNHLPITIEGPLQGGRVSMRGSESSQYFSSLLIAGALASGGIEINVEGRLVSKPYIDMSISLMRRFGAWVDSYPKRYYVPGRQTYYGCELEIESDPVSSSYFLAAACLLGGKVRIPRYNPFSLQGEARFYQILERLGAKISWENSSAERRLGAGNAFQTLILEGPGHEHLRSIEIDMAAMPDVVQTLAVMMAFAKGKTKLKNIAHLRYKESNRITETAEALRKLGIKVYDGWNYLIIEGGKPHAALIQAHQDHRMAMSFALAGLVVSGIRIDDPSCVAKSFPAYWETLAEMGIQIQVST